MNEQFFHDRAKTVRDLAERADPHTKRRLLDLASRYEQKPRPPTPLVKPKSESLTSAVGLVEEILSIPGGGLSALVDGDDNREKVPVAPLTSRLLSDVIQRRDEG